MEGREKRNERETERERERDRERMRASEKKQEKRREDGTHKKREGINCGWRERNRIKTLEKERPTPSRTTYGEVP